MIPSITSTANPSAEGLSYSRLTIWDRRSSPDIRLARVTEGVNPAAAAKITSTGIPNSAVRYRFRKVTVVRNPTRIEMCRPDTAATWRMPLIFSAVSVA